MLKQLGLPPSLDTLLEVEDRESPIWVVGGALRDHFFQRQSHDVDFVTAGNAIRLARTVADALEGDVYVLDRERGAARVLYRASENQRWTFDFAEMRGDSIEADLRARDFPINALASRLSTPDELIDPCGGLQQIRDRQLTLCSEQAIDDDPIRSLRAIRIATDLTLKMDAQVIQSLRNVESFDTISIERIRDEVFNIFDLENPSPALRLMLEFDLLGKSLRFSHSQDLSTDDAFFERETVLYAIRCVDNLRNIMALLSPNIKLEESDQATLGLLTWMLGRYRMEIHNYLAEELSPDRNHRALFLFFTFLHPTFTRLEALANAPAPQTGYIGQEKYPLRMDVLKQFRLSRAEILAVEGWTRGLNALDADPDADEHPDLYCFRYFKHSGKSGVGAILSKLAFELALEDSPPPVEHWSERLDRSRTLLDAWFEAYESIVDPEPFLSGEDIMQILGKAPGPEIGNFLQLIVEKQVSGEVSSRDEALEFLRGIA